MSDDRFELYGCLGAFLVYVIGIGLMFYLMVNTSHPVSEIARLCPVDGEVLQLPCKYVPWMADI